MNLQDLPKAVEDIIYKYIHQMNMINVTNEICEKYVEYRQYCGICQREFLSFAKNTCYERSCTANICKECICCEITHEYMFYQEPGKRQLWMDLTDEEQNNLVNKIRKEIKCMNCTYMAVSEDEDEDAEEWHFRQLESEMHGTGWGLF